MKQISDYLPKDGSKDWAYGCPACTFGIVTAPDIISALPLHESRAVQCAEEMILFCDCRAGHMYRQALRRVYGALAMEMRRNILAHVSAASVPTVHGEPA